MGTMTRILHPLLMHKHCRQAIFQTIDDEKFEFSKRPKRDI